MERQYLQGKEIIFTRSVVEVVLPALQTAAKKKFSDSFSAERRKYERIEKQIQREREDASHRLLLEKREFVRCNFLLKQQRKPFSGSTTRRDVREFEENILVGKLRHAERQEKHSGVDVVSDKMRLNRSPYYFPPLYKNVIKDLKDIQTSQLRMDLAKREPADLKELKNCRYLRLRLPQERENQTKNSDLESEKEKNNRSTATCNQV